MVTQKNIWGDATRSGFVLGIVSIAYFVINLLLTKLPEGKAVGVLVNVGGILLWVVKLIACISLMKFFIKKFADNHSDATNSHTFRFGCATACLSALLYAAFYLAWVTLVDPNMFQDSMEQAMQASQSMFGSAQMESMEELLPKLPAITFFANLIWCYLFGVLLSAIFSRNIPSRNPFNNVAPGPDEQ